MNKSGPSEGIVFLLYNQTGVLCVKVLWVYDLPSPSFIFCAFDYEESIVIIHIARGQMELNKL